VGSALDNIRVKLDRADESLRTFEDELAKFNRAVPLQIGFNANVQVGWDLVYIQRATPLPPRFAVLVGESLYHARSVLEHLVWALVTAHGGKPGRSHTFPIWDKPREESGMTVTDTFVSITKRNQLKGAPLDAILRIESLQPYHKPQPSVFFLSILHRMALEDRHHALHSAFVGGMALTEEDIQVPPNVQVTHFRNLLRTGQPLEAGTRVALVKVSPQRKPSSVRLKAAKRLSFLAFGPRLTDMVPVSDFKEINTHLRIIVERLGTAFL
jgi:hypothetical protein